MKWIVAESIVDRRERVTQSECKAKVSSREQRRNEAPKLREPWQGMLPLRSCECREKIRRHCNKELMTSRRGCTTSRPASQRQRNVPAGLQCNTRLLLQCDVASRSHRHIFNAKKASAKTNISLTDECNSGPHQKFSSLWWFRAKFTQAQQLLEWAAQHEDEPIGEDDV